MNTLRIFKPFRPFIVTQHWGNPNPKYADHFNDSSFKRHNGLDATPTKDVYGSKYPVYCPVEGFTVHRVRYAPQGGGHEIWLVSKEKLTIGDKVCNAYIVLCHADRILVEPGYKPALGELIMMGDNTGFSTGLHTHIGLYRVDYDGKKITYLDQNDATNSYDPQLHLSPQFAVDLADFSTLVRSGLRLMKYYVGL